MATGTKNNTFEAVLEAVRSSANTTTNTGAAIQGAASVGITAKQNTKAGGTGSSQSKSASASQAAPKEEKSSSRSSASRERGDSRFSAVQAPKAPAQAARDWTAWEEEMREKRRAYREELERLAKAEEHLPYEQRKKESDQRAHDRYFYRGRDSQTVEGLIGQLQSKLAGLAATPVTSPEQAAQNEAQKQNIEYRLGGLNLELRGAKAFEYGWKKFDDLVVPESAAPTQNTTGQGLGLAPTNGQLKSDVRKMAPENVLLSDLRRKRMEQSQVSADGREQPDSEMQQTSIEKLAAYAEKQQEISVVAERNKLVYLENSLKNQQQALEDYLNHGGPIDKEKVTEYEDRIQKLSQEIGELKASLPPEPKMEWDELAENVGNIVSAAEILLNDGLDLSSPGGFMRTGAAVINGIASVVDIVNGLYSLLGKNNSALSMEKTGGEQFSGILHNMADGMSSLGNGELPESLKKELPESMKVISITGQNLVNIVNAIGQAAEFIGKLQELTAGRRRDEDGSQPEDVLTDFPGTSQKSGSQLAEKIYSFGEWLSDKTSLEIPLREGLQSLFHYVMTGDLDLSPLKDWFSLSPADSGDGGELLKASPSSAAEANDWWDSQLDDLLRDNGIDVPLHDFSNHDTISSEKSDSSADDGFYIDSYKKVRSALSAKRKQMKETGEDDGTGWQEQAHHLNQNAAFNEVIPADEGVSVPLEGNILEDIGSPHYKAHQVMEEFWAPYRPGGEKERDKPTIGEYNIALGNSLTAAGLSEEQVKQAVEAARRQQQAYGLTEDKDVPNVPKSINLRK